MITAKKKRFTFQEYLDFERASSEKHEFIDGKILKMAGGTGNHGIIAANIVAELKFALKQKDKKYFVLGSDLKIRIEAINQARYPDALVICEELEYYDNRKDVILNPLLIVEVLSPGTQKYDRGAKFDEYKTIPSFIEYVLVSQKMPYVSTYFREEEDLWRIKTTMNKKASVYLKSIEAELNLEDIYDGVNFED
jgi:Uma2 family endonuclease